MHRIAASSSSLNTDGVRRHITLAHYRVAPALPAPGARRVFQCNQYLQSHQIWQWIQLLNPLLVVALVSDASVY